jgi:hypothetical protein
VASVGITHGKAIMTLLSIDPGNEQSAYVLWDGKIIISHQKLNNSSLIESLVTCSLNADEMVIEQIASFGMPVGCEVFETVFWSGRFAQAFYAQLKPVARLKRMDVKMHLCHSSRAKDGNIRQALIDRLGPPGTKKAPGATYGIHADEWAALAVACTFSDKRKAGEI